MYSVWSGRLNGSKKCTGSHAGGGKTSSRQEAARDPRASPKEGANLGAGWQGDTPVELFECNSNKKRRKQAEVSRAISVFGVQNVQACHAVG